MRFGVAIPCYRYHIPKLRRCLDGIAAQTKRPEIVIVSCSSSTASDFIEAYDYSFPVRFLIHAERQNAAQNRNCAMNVLKTEDITHITFIDADDRMLPWRLQLIDEALERHPQAEIVLHSFVSVSEKPPKAAPERPDIRFDALRKDYCYGASLDRPGHIHHSQSTVPRDTTVRYREDAANERREDSVFCSDILIPGTRSIYIGDPLTIYEAEGAWH